MSTWRVERPFLSRIEGDLKYGLLLLICAIIATFLRKKASLNLRRNIDGTIGFLITLIICKEVTLYSLSIVLINMLAMKLLPSKYLVHFSFFVTFAHLGFLRIAHNYGLPKLEFIANAIQLIMTLRVIGLSYEIHDSVEADERAKKDDARNDGKRYIVIPSAFEIFNYCYSYMGLFTGPYYTYQTYYDAMHSQHVQQISVRSLILVKLRTLFWSLPLLILFYIMAPIEVLRSEKILKHNLPTLLTICSFAFCHLRVRIYTAWMIAESICILGGIGVYPISCRSAPGIGPRNINGLRDAGRPGVKYDAETIDNLDIPHVESSDGFRSGMRAWNRTVQFWLANFVYKRSPRFIRMPYTMLVSAFWHGVHPGYFLSFLTIPLCTTAEDMVFAAIPRNPRTGQHPLLFQFVWEFIRMRGFEMMACGFLLLTWEDTIRLWNCLYWWCHIVMLIVMSASLGALLAIRKAHRRNGI